MICRAFILLPYSIAIRPDDEFPASSFPQGELKVVIRRPTQGTILRSPGSLPRIGPAQVEQTTEDVRVGDRPTVQANLLRIDFVREEFDRTRTPPHVSTDDDHGDPSAHLIFSVANSFLVRLRHTLAASSIRPVSPGGTDWTIEYVDDRGNELPRDENKFRRRAGRRLALNVLALDTEAWQRTCEMPRDFVPHAWETLLLDSQDLLPDVAPAIAMANAAIEVFAKWAVDEVAKTVVRPNDLWDYVSDRSDYRANPAVEDCLGNLLAVLLGWSLKEDQALWNDFKRLRSARNRLSHEGVLSVNKEPISHEEAARLVRSAVRIVSTVEARLPEGLRRRPPHRIPVEVRTWLS